MSLRNKLLDAARVAVQEERVRITRILDRVEKECVEGVEKKLLREVERHAAEVKLQLARAVIERVRSGIMLGVDLPAEQETEDDDDGCALPG